VVAAAATLLAVSHSIGLAVVALIAAGAAWITGLGLLGTAYQSQLPAWVKARSFSYYLVAFQGANAIGALCLGAVAQATSVSTAFLIIGGGLAISAVATWPLALPDQVPSDDGMAEPVALPQLDGEPLDGPVLVTVDYPLAPGQADAFLDLGTQLRRLRRRTGAQRWHLHRDVDALDRFSETFLVGSWEEHERQHARLAHGDRELLDRIDELLAPGQVHTVRHAFGVEPPRHRSRPDLLSP
jgi:hypothetical protein